MEFHEVIEKRRSIRKYLNQEVDESLIEQLINSARLAQSAKNRQPWKFMLLNGQEKDHIAQIMLDLFDKTNTEMPGYTNSSQSSANIMKNAPAIILVFRENDPDWLMSDVLSIGAAIEHVCLEAVNLGLGTVWIADVFYSATEILEYVGYSDLQLISAIAVGYPAESPNPRPRKTMDEIIIKKQ